MSETKCRILCVDDHADTAEMLGMLLSQEDYEVTTCTSMEEAMALTATRDFDLYVLDRRLPNGSGMELCQMLLSVKPSVPCIFYSGDAYSLHRTEAFAAGAAAYVPKPDIEGLIAAVHRLLAEQECASEKS